MFDPFTMFAVSAGTSVLKGILGSEAAEKEAQAKAQQAAYRAAIARKNAAINRKNAEFALDAGEANALRSGLTTQFNIAKQRVGQAAGGFDVDTGTNLAVRESTHKIGLRDQETIRREAGRKAHGLRMQAEANELEAGMQDAAGASALEAGKTNIFSTLLGTATGVADKWMQFSSASGSAGSGITSYDENFQPVAFTPT